MLILIHLVGTVLSSYSQEISVNVTEDSLCSGQTTIMSVTGGSNLSFVWSPPNGLNSTTGRTVSATPFGMMTYTIDAYVGAGNWKTVSASENKCLGIKQNGMLFDLKSSSPYVTAIGMDTGWVAVSSNAYKSYALKNDGTIWSWWNNIHIYSYPQVPVKLDSNNSWGAIYSASSYVYQGPSNVAYNIFLTKSGTAWASGSNSEGQLGIGNNVYPTGLVKISGPHDDSWSTLALGIYHALGIKKSGSLWGWGKNYSTSPIRIGTDSNWIAVSTQASTSIGLKKDGTLWQWAAGAAPTQVGSDTTWASISAGTSHFTALKTNGTLWLWGESNGYMGFTGTLSAPTQVGTDTDWKMIAAGPTYSQAAINNTAMLVAIKQNGVVWIWGPTAKQGRQVETGTSTLVKSITQKINVESILMDFQPNKQSQCMYGNNFVFTNKTSMSGGTIQQTFWDFGNGVTSTLNTLPAVNYQIPGDYRVKLTSISQTGCKDSMTRVVTVNPMPVAAFTVNNNSQCLLGNNFIFNNSSSNTFGVLAYQWDFGNGAKSLLSEPSYSYQTSGTYDVKLKVTTDAGCSDSTQRSVYVAAIKPQALCMVTVDSASGKNSLIWERSDKNQHSGYRIYKETTVSNIYSPIGFVPSDSLGLYTDTASDPKTKADRYKIAAIDTCAGELEKSPAHKTMHLTVSGGVGNTWNLNWESYEGLSANTINIYRGPRIDSMFIIGSVQGSINSYSDFTAPPGSNYYKVGIDFGVTCDPAVYNKTQYSVTNSNIVYAEVIKTGINPVTLLEHLSVSPNPSTGLVNVQFESSAAKIDIAVYDVSGKRVYHSDSLHGGGYYRDSLNLSALDKGIYIVKISTGQGVKNMKLILQ